MFMLHYNLYLALLYLSYHLVSSLNAPLPKTHHRPGSRLTSRPLQQTPDAIKAPAKGRNPSLSVRYAVMWRLVSTAALTSAKPARLGVRLIRKGRG